LALGNPCHYHLVEVVQVITSV